VTDETRTRFLAAIAAQLPVERIVEVHLFPAIRQGGMESGVAVVAMDRDVGDVSDASAADTANSEDAEVPTDDVDAESVEIRRAEPRGPLRYTVYSARYRHTLKGPDRGKWEVNVTEEADAPLLTVDAVVRGVQRRSGDADEIVRLSGDDVRAALPVVAAP
jgi:hypothetical protein